MSALDDILESDKIFKKNNIDPDFKDNPKARYYINDKKEINDPDFYIKSKNKEKKEVPIKNLPLNRPTREIEPIPFPLGKSSKDALDLLIKGSKK